MTFRIVKSNHIMLKSYWKYKVSTQNNIESKQEKKTIYANRCSCLHNTISQNKDDKIKQKPSETVFMLPMQHGTWDNPQ